MKRIETVFVIALLLFGSVSNAQNPRYVKSDKYEGVVMLKVDPFAFYEYVPREGWKNLYVPTDHEIDLAEKKIEKTISVLVYDFEKSDPYIKISCDIPKNLFKYKRYYFGYKSKEEKLISIFLANDPNRKEWKKGPIIVEDGGCYYLYLQYSITNDKIFGLNIKY